MDSAAKVLLTAGVLLLAACTSKQPVLYPNPHLQEVGSERAQADVASCMRLARDYGLDGGQARGAATDTATEAVVGGATGAAAGAVVDHPGRGAAVGATAGATRSFVRWLLGSREPDPVFRAFVERCLQERGYETIGWR